MRTCINNDQPESRGRSVPGQTYTPSNVPLLEADQPPSIPGLTYFGDVDWSFTPSALATFFGPWWDKPLARQDAHAETIDDARDDEHGLVLDGAHQG